MKVNHHQNILYKERIKNHPRVIQEQPSLQDNDIQSIYRTPLERASNEISFKGVPSSIKKAAEDLMYRKTRAYDYQASISTLKRFYKSGITSLTEGLKGHKDITDHLVHDIVTDKIQFKEKTPLKLIAEGILYPFIKLPVHISDSIIDVLRKRQILPENYGKTGKSLYSKHRFKLDDDDKFNSLIGFIKSAHKYKHDTEKIRSAGLFRDGMKMFDPKSGNYNGVHERALTRIVTGFIPAFFLANDAYNLSRLCDDDPKAAEKEKKIRFNQESKRILSNAYIQLITLGALSKFINASKSAFVTVTVLSTLFTEIYSRLSNGKKIHFISKQEAQKINAKEKLKHNNEKADNETNVKQPEQTQQTNPTKENSVNAPAFKGSSIFKDFDLASNISFTDAPKIQKEEEDNSNTPKVAAKEIKPLLNLDTIVKWVIGTIAIGYALRGAKKGLSYIMTNPKTSQKAVVKKMLSFSQKAEKLNKNLEKFLKLDKTKGSNIFAKIYNKITTEEHIVKKADFDKIAQRLSEYDLHLGNKYETVTKNYQRTRAIKKFGNELANDLKDAGLNSLAEEFTKIANGSFSKSRKDAIITNNINHFLKELRKEGEFSLANEIKRMLIMPDGKIQAENYEKISKMLKKLAKTRRDSDLKEFYQSFDNVFKVDMDTQNLQLYFKAINELTLKKKFDAVNKYKQYMFDAINNETYNLGTKNRFIAKEATDFFIQPFKFIWNTITFPYKLATKIEKMTRPVKAPEWKDEIQTVSTSIKKIGKTFDKIEKDVEKWNKRALKHNQIAQQTGKELIELKEVDKEFAKIMNKKISKAFNTVTMSNISNAELSELAKYSTTAATAWFLIADNYNMVMLKSNGENKKEAGMKAKERALQETSRLFYSQLLINLFNSTFRNLYNSSLFGAQTVNTMSTLLGEYSNRKAIGVPVKECSREEILQADYENINSAGLKGKFFRFMSRLTGKRALTQRDNKPKVQENNK